MTISDHVKDVKETMIIFHKPHSTLHPIPVPGEVWQQVQQVQHENDHIILLLFLDR